MYIRLASIPRLQLFIWLFPLLYFVHDLEEILTVEAFIIKQSDVIPFQITVYQFAVAFLLLWLAALIGCYQVARKRRFLGMKATTFFAFLVTGVLLANGLSHLLQAFFFQAYVPGLITSILVIYPYCLVTLNYLLKEQLLTMNRFLVYLSIGLIVQIPLALTAHMLSYIVIHYLLFFFQ